MCSFNNNPFDLLLCVASLLCTLGVYRGSETHSYRLCWNERDTETSQVNFFVLLFCPKTKWRHKSSAFLLFGSSIWFNTGDPEESKEVLWGHIPAERTLKFQSLSFSVSLCFKLLIKFIFTFKFYVHKVYDRMSFNASGDGGLYSSHLLNSSVKTQNVKRRTLPSSFSV